MCLAGCALWERALEASCQSVCNGTQELLPPKELYCVMGCNDAIDRYLQNLKDSLGQPSAPALVADSLTPASVMLEWERANYHNLTAVVQWSYEAPLTSWQYARNQSWIHHNQVFVSGLRPYTNYRFRVVLLAQETELVASESSLVIGTLPSGLPSSPPSLVRATAPDPTRVSVSWLPGPFPNGPILSYVVSIDEQPNGYKAHKDIPVSENKEFYMFQSLGPSRNYSVSVAMRNAVGLGPAASTTVSTPPQSQRVALHIRKELLFVSDSLGRVVVTSSKNRPERRVLLSHVTHHDLMPHSLSVDWLNDQLYILGQVGQRWQVARCELDGTGMLVALAGLLDKPLHIEIDPYNGYLFWVIQGIQRGGLYRLDLADISNGIKHEVTPDLILSDADLGAFTVDHTNFRILVSNHLRNTVLSVSLDGKEVSDFRANTQRPQFEKVLSMTMANGLFSWTNGEIILTEEYHRGHDSYFHNLAFPSFDNPGYVSIGVDLPSAQPVPLPVNPPTGLQAIVSSNHARATWNIPHLLGGQGKGAWQNWSYQLSIEERGKETGAVLLKDINSTWVRVADLQADLEYTLKVAAFTSAGVGPWSAEFKGKTLKSSSSFGDTTLTNSSGGTTFVWSARQGLLLSDPTGETLTNLIPAQQLQDSRGLYHITDITWYKDLLYLVTNSTSVLWYNMTSKERGKLREVDTVGSIAVDWVGKKLYWSNPKQQLITRGNLNGSEQEPLSILTVAKELNIDAVEAFIYWSTGHAVECARLNGKQRHTYYPAELFSGKQVMGLTLDMITRDVFWIVRNYEGSTLFKADMAEGRFVENEVVPIKIALIQYPDIQGPLCYFDEHLLWLRDDRNAVIADLTGSNTAQLTSLSLTGLHVVTVIDDSLHTLPGISDEANVNAIPEPVDVDSLKIVGNFSNFNISWHPVENVNCGEVFYELKIGHSRKKEIQIETTYPSWLYPLDEVPPPYTSLMITVRALTYWGNSPHVRTNLHSPEGVPSPPSYPRAYVIFNTSPVDNRQVRACTSMGCGIPSHAVIARTDRQAPIPRLLMATNDTLSLADIDRRDNVTLSHSAVGAITDITYSSHFGKVYWIDDNNHIVYARTDTRSKVKVLSLNGTGLSVAMDWVGNALYWSERDERSGNSDLKKLDLTQWERGVTQIKLLFSKINASIRSLQVDPFNSHIYWHESRTNNVSNLWIGTLDGLEMKQYFKAAEEKRKVGRSDCSCPEEPLVSSTFTLDLLTRQLIWIDLSTNKLIAADKEGCQCTTIVDSLFQPQTGLPASSITSDQEFIYWSNERESRLYNVAKREINDSRGTPVDVRFEYIPGIRRITAFGKHLQPYPDLKCLIPPQPANPLHLVARTSDSITLGISEPTKNINNNCWNVSLPSSLYTVYYGVLNSVNNDSDCIANVSLCTTLESFKKDITVENLKPFTEYIFMVTEKNYYSDLSGVIAELSEPVIYQTAAGAPSPPEHISAIVLSPNTVEVSWEPPRLLNSETVWYEVVWTSESLVDGARHRGEQVVTSPQESILAGNMTGEGDGDSIIVSSRLYRLTPGVSYLVRVRAYSQSTDVYSESSGVVVKTFPEPNNLTLINVTAYTLQLSWDRNPDIPYICHEVEYIDGSTGESNLIQSNSSDNTEEVYMLDELKPKTVYTFRDRPSRPGIPVIRHLSGDVFQVTWDPSRENGSPIEIYCLEGINLSPKIDRDKRGTNGTNLSATEDSWTLYYNGTDNYWIISDLNYHERYKFRVRSKNDYGWSDYSEASGSFNLTKAAMLAVKSEFTIIIWVLTPAAIILTAFIFLCVLYRNEKVKKCGSGNSTGGGGMLVDGTKGPDVELASLRQIPRWSAHVQSTNILYSAGELAPIDLLPHLARDQITLTKFLGSGAFGEVFEGLARSLPGAEDPQIKVAVKTLRKGANENEKAEFLKEAQLMSNFKHAHILQLLGVCLDNDPNFIIMELMEGGDLLSYLRASRPIGKAEIRLTLLDLVAMCVDVARGCCYLEEMHFVHRDLAARNCLVSSRDPAVRVVKIGDFGLARDIYKNDYYRKEGEGLLPVRWMAPESLVYGVFTCQSDVWAFGVLLWEIMSLGQQPYPARNNVEVLHYVRNGGRLGQPPNSSTNMYQLMMKCWSFNPEERPTFRYCLDVLDDILSHTDDVALQGTFISDGRQSIRSDNQNEEVTTVPEQSIPKYLELLYDQDDSSGYEIPRSLEPSSLDTTTTTTNTHKHNEDEEDRSSLEKLLPVTIDYTNLNGTNNLNDCINNTALQNGTLTDSLRR
uniref:Tyrosine-protein kinase receptor n=1 Tax=Rhodnius prolixus TaxID=13249 RepID=T1HB35_RHOPR